MTKIAQTLKEILLSFLILTLAAFCLISGICDTVSNIYLVKDGTYTIATVKNVTQVSSGGRHSKEAYSIEVSFEQNDEIISKKFKKNIDFTDKVGDYFNTNYRIGNKIAIIVSKDGKTIPYSDRKTVFFENAKTIIFGIILLTMGVFFLGQLAHSEEKKSKELKNKFYIQSKDFKIKNLNINSVNPIDYLKKIENNEIICFGFSVTKDFFCEYSFENKTYFERIADGKEEVTYNISDRSKIIQRLEEISKLTKKYT